MKGSGSRSPILRRFAALCEAAGEPPGAADFLAGYPEASASQRADVMLLDMARRYSLGECVRVEEYLARDAEFPSFCSSSPPPAPAGAGDEFGVAQAAEEDLALELILAEHDLRAQQGREPPPDEFVSRFPTLADRIRGLLSDRADDERVPPYPELIHRVFERPPSSGTGWGTLTGSTTGFGSGLQLADNTRAAGRRGSLVAECWPFSTLTSPVVQLLESQMQVADFDVGEHLMRQGDPGTSLMVLADGEVEISTTDEEGRRRRLTRTGRVQVLGEMALLTDNPRSADVVALKPVRTLLLPAEQFHKLAARFPEISVVLSLLLAERLGMPGRDDVLAGKTFDAYRIQRRLGRGGMSVVYDARHVESDRHVALKMMSHRLVYDQEALDQFQAEADMIQSFRHENIVRLFGRFAAFHTYFMVMEFADGVTLTDFIERHGALPEAEFRQAFGQIVRALRYAHAAGVVHRDVKPSNIMLTREGIVKLMDFGLAASALETAAADRDRIVGTPRYMAPEQMIGGGVNAAADLFSLGCVGYEMLTGERLIVEDDMLEMLRRHANWQVPELRRLRPEVSVDVAAAVESCLPLDPDERRLDLDSLEKWAAPLDASRIG